MLDFKNLIRASEFEVKNTDDKNFKQTLNTIFRYIDKRLSETEEPDISDVIIEIMDDMKEYLVKINRSTIKYGAIEYYLNRKLNSTTGYNLEKAYKDVCQAEKKGELDISSIDIQSMQYSYNLEENMRRMVIIDLYEIREDKKVLTDFFNGSSELTGTLNWLLDLKSNQRDRALRRLARNTEEFKQLKKGLALLQKSEKELLQERIQGRTENILPILKEECIKEIVESVKILDKMGLIETYTNLNNKAYNSIFIKDYEYTYDEIKDLLSSDELKKLSCEQLIAMASFWTNRVIKIFQDLNKSIYIISHPELCEQEILEDGICQIQISEKNLDAVALKKRFLHKVCFELFSDLYKDKSQDNEVLQNKLKKICKKYGDEYKAYFDKLLPKSENSLDDDLVEGFLYENTIYNSYMIKNINMETILISLLNSNLSNIENFGYIKEDNLDISKKKYVLIGMDIRGMNMPCRLHINKNQLIEILRSAQNGNTMFPVYRGGSDFQLNKDMVMSAHIYVPTSTEKKHEFKRATERVQVTKKYKNAMEHLNYILGNGKMPKHMKNYKGPQYIDIAGTEDEIDHEI